jgi:hypothetical protein
VQRGFVPPILSGGFVLPNLRPSVAGVVSFTISNSPSRRRGANCPSHSLETRQPYHILIS